MPRKKKEEKEENYERWLLPYADMITLLLAFFIIMYALTLMEKDKAAKILAELGGAFGGETSSGTPSLANYGKKSPNPLKKPGSGIFKKGTNKKISYIENTGTNPTVGNILNVVGARGDTGETTFLDSDSATIEIIKKWKKALADIKDDKGAGKENLPGMLEALNKLMAAGININAQTLDKFKAIKKVIDSFGKQENAGGKNDMLVQLAEIIDKGLQPSAEAMEKLNAIKKLLDSFGKIENDGGKSDFLVQLAMAAEANADVNIGQAGGNTAGVGGPSSGASMSDIAEKMQNIFGDDIKNGSIEIKISQRGIEITLQSDLVFELGAAELTPAAQKLLEKIGTILKPIHKMNFRFRVEGHTDNINVHSFLYPSNWELSCARSVSVVRYLVEEMDLPAESISAEGFGSYKPVASNDTVIGRRRNRRVEILIYDPLKQINVPRELLRNASRETFDRMRNSLSDATVEVGTAVKKLVSEEVKLNQTARPAEKPDDKKKNTIPKKR